VPSSRLTLLVGPACAILGLGAGIALTRHPAPARATAAAAAATDTPPSREVVAFVPTRARLDDEEKQTLRTIVREELAAERAAASASPSAKPATAADATWQLSSDAMKVYDDVRVRVDDAIARRTWSNEDRAALRPQLAQLPPEARIEAMRPLLIAVNQGKVNFTGHGPLL